MPFFVTVKIMKPRKKLWRLPSVLNRKFSFWEKLDVFLTGPYYKDDTGEWRIKPYALRKRFVGEFAIENPYIMQMGKVKRYLVHEEIFYRVLTLKKNTNEFVEAVKETEESLNEVQSFMKTIQKEQKALRTPRDDKRD